ncbi:NADPH-dependent F420 reductase [Winogradskyella luteola]|uniref:NAD(P)-binding domain-containing protein n=1 Tax=Winogradskyella luteola TaxID=2828330 RepID=A0A9X1JTD7_9FLAO|nr:NAD(P)-binding domain-containing protein [Winogradskyella luteola]MBV7270532.1 NAD(P)-binding domain-containing protein [Winogradskyella luteola]
MKLAFIGIGNVGFALANNLQKRGHKIIVAHNDSNNKTVKEALMKNNGFSTTKVQEAINNSEAVFLAVPFFAAEELLKPLKFNGKPLIDCTNPVGKGISHGLESEISGAEKIQEWANDAKVVKAYTIYGFENLINSSFSNYNVKPVMLIAGNFKASKSLVSALNEDLGFMTLDTGNLDQSLHLEHMTLLWVKMVRRDGHHPNFTWAYLEKQQ